MAAADPLAAFRRSGTAPASGEPEGQGAYRAYAVANERPVRIDIRTAEIAYAPLYSALTNIIYDPDDYTGVFLIFSFKLEVEIEGKNLQPIVETLKLNTCAFLEQYTTRYAAPDSKAPLIERITITGLTGRTIRVGSERT